MGGLTLLKFKNVPIGSIISSEIGAEVNINLSSAHITVVTIEAARRPATF